MSKSAAGAWPLILCLILPTMGWAQGPASSTAYADPATFVDVPSSGPARELADWVLATQDASGLSFIIVDKVNAAVFVFSPNGALLGAGPVLLGVAHGDDSPPGIGDRALSTITAAERITPAGRFVAAPGRNLGGDDIIWVDYDAAVSLHRVVTSNAAERRLERLATPSPLDNRISYGCINVPKAFYEGVVAPIFLEGGAIIYVLPETRSIAEEFFALALR